MKKSELRLLIRLSIRLHNASTNRRSRRLVKLSPAMRGYAGDDNGFIDDDTLLNLVVPLAIMDTLLWAAENSAVMQNLLKNMNLQLLQYGITDYKEVMSYLNLYLKFWNYVNKLSL